MVKGKLCYLDEILGAAGISPHHRGTCVPAAEPARVSQGSTAARGHTFVKVSRLKATAPSAMQPMG